MFNTEKLIHEVKIRDQLWNCNSNLYLDRVARRSAWKEIAQAFYRDWDDLTAAEQGEKVVNLMRKWRNTRDYYIKEKKKSANSKSSGVRKKKKYNYYDNLYFLDAFLKQKRILKGDNSSDEIIEEYLEDPHTDSVISCEEHPNREEDSNESSSNDISHTIKQEEEEGEEEEEAITSKKMLPFETHMMAPTDVSQDDDNDNVKANKNFLLSLLPDVTSLNGRQNMRFRLGVLNLLNDIKFEPK